MTDRFVDFDLTDKLTGDPKELADTLKVQVDAGIITRNEARRILNLPPRTTRGRQADRLRAQPARRGAGGRRGTTPTSPSAADGEAANRAAGTGTGPKPPSPLGASSE
jgi:hypothetical protein